MAVSTFWMFTGIVLGVFAISGLFGWMMWQAAKSIERSDSDPRYRRRQIALLAAVYVVSMVVGITQVVRGKQSVLSLAGLPIPLLIVYVLLRTALRTKTPPQGKS
jgi:hypothetical protein